MDIVVRHIVRMSFIIIITIVLVIITRRRSIINKIGKGRANVSKKELVNNNQFVLKNREKLEKIFDEKYQELLPVKNKLLYAAIFLVLCIVLSFIIKNKYFSIFSIGLSIVILGINIYQYDKDSDKKYHEIVKDVLHDFDSDLEYNPYQGFSASEYSLCRFPEECDIFHSEDMIINSKKDFRYADIKVESEHTDSDNNTYEVTEYEGSLAKMHIKDVNCKIYLGGMKTNWFFKDSCVKIKFENDEFNKLFMAYSDDELMAYKILTPDVMEEFVNIKNNAFGDIDIRIINDKLYIRFLSGNSFDNSMVGKNSDRENLCQSIAVLEEVMKTMEKVKKIIENKNID